jgi:hypothetical protein
MNDMPKGADIKLEPEFNITSYQPPGDDIKG